MYKNPFIIPESEYKRDLNPVANYISQASLYLSIQKNIPIEQARSSIVEGIKNKTFPRVRNPKVTHTLREDNGDRHLTETPLITYISDIVKNNQIVAPTLTCYTATKDKVSLLSLDIENNIKKRNIHKKAMFAAEARGDTTTQFFENVGQRNTKLSNNSISGMHGVPNNPIYNPSAHPTLTSNCRMTSGFGNANNEKLIAGNRHYFKPTIILNNIVSTIANSDYEKIEKVINKYNLHLPTTEDVMDCILYCSSLYGIVGGTYVNHIREFVDKLNPLQKAAFLYTGDLYHLRKHNDSFVREFLSKLIKKVEGVEVDNPLQLLKDLYEDHVIFAHQICSREMAGKGKDYKALENTPTIHLLAATAQNVSKTIDEYSDYIEAFLVTNNVPAAVPYFPDSIRRASLLSDTDSTFATAQDWQKWYHGKISFDDEAIALGACIIFLASQSIINVLAIMSKNAGIDDKYLRKIAMKNEFYYPVIAPTKVAKHYYGVISCQEGNVYTEEKFKYDIKGVHLKNSNAPKFIMEGAQKMMKDILTDIRKEGSIELAKYLKRVADIEREVYEGIKAGKLEFFRLGEIKTKDSYKKSPMESAYMHYLLWKDCFSHKYGDYGEPPYQVIRVSTSNDNPKKTKEWLDSIKDKKMSDTLREWMIRNDKKYLSTFQIPVQVVYTHGLPEEIYQSLDIRSMVINLTSVFYLILETLGFYCLNDKETTLISDYY